MLKRIEQPQGSGPGDDIEVAGSPGPIDFDQLLAAARRQARVVAAAAVVGVLLGLAYIVTAVPQYTAATAILIDSQKGQNALSASIAELTFDTGAIDSQVEVLKSEKIALSVISTMNLTHDPEFMGARGTLIGQAFGLLRAAFDFSGWFVSREKSDAEEDVDLTRAAIGELGANLAVGRVARTYVLAVYYTSPDRNKAAAIANAFAEAYLTDQLDAKFDATRRAAGWLQSRIADLKQQSLDADFAIQKFKADKGIVVTGGDRPGLMSDQQLTELNGQLVLARADTAKAEARYQQIQDLLKSGRVGASVPDSLANPVITDLREKFLASSKLEAQLESKLGSGHLQVINLRREMEEYQRLIFEELQRIGESYRSDAEVARQKEKSLSLSMSGLVGASAGTNQTMVQLRELERESETYRNLYQTFMQRYQEAIQQQSFPVSEARVITAATPPQSASRPRRHFILALSLVMGAMVGAGLGALREYRDRVFRTASQVRDELGLEFLGLLQNVEAPVTVKSAKGESQDPKQIHVVNSLQRYSIDHPLSSFSETLRSAKVAVDLALGDKKPKVVGVISVLPNEGKSTVAKNFASLLAHLGARAVLIDGDLRNPGLTRAMARQAEAGVLEAIRSDRPLRDLLLSEPDSGLFVLPAVIRKRVQHSSEILSSAGMRGVVAEAGKAFDYVIIDLPPLGPVVDVRAAGSLFDGFLLVVEWGRTPRAMVKNILTSDSAVYEKCLGVLFNKVNLQKVKLYEGYGSKDYYYRRYSKYYHNDKA
ncbi:MAG: GNVR domain-containing protein [Roseiarcus sp.]|jgi:succinoglycan biosynthesis transport protein ExoP